MDNNNKYDAYLDPEAQIFVAPNFQAFIKPRDYVNKNKKLKKVTVKFLTENFEPKDVDNDHIYIC